MTNETKTLTNANPTYVEFDNIRIMTVLHEGMEYFSPKPISDSLGLDWNAQRKRINRDAVLQGGGVIMTLPSISGDQETLCLPLDMLNGWLFGIDASRVKPGIKEKILFYKRECYRALHSHFFKIEHSKPAAPQVHYHFHFKGVELAPVKHEDDYWYDPEAIGQALGYNGHPRECVGNLYQENKKAFEGLVALIRVPRAAGRRTMRFYNRGGMEKVAEISRADNAEEFREFLKQTRQVEAGTLPCVKVPEKPPQPAPLTRTGKKEEITALWNKIQNLLEDK